jgi:hypothetical protein
MRSVAAAFAILSFLGLGTGSVNFDSVQPGVVPPDWTFTSTHGGTPGRWEVRFDRSAPSRGNVLEQVAGTSGEYDFPVGVFDKVTCRDGDLSVKFRIDGGRMDRTVGLVWRYQDPNNYYLLHFSADEKNIVLFRVRGGRVEPVPVIGGRRGALGVAHDIRVGQWYVAKVEFRGTRIRVLFGNRRLFDADDSALAAPGKTGVWTRGRTTASFDDFRIDKKG